MEDKNNLNINIPEDDVPEESGSEEGQLKKPERIPLRMNKKLIIIILIAVMIVLAIANFLLSRISNISNSEVQNQEKSGNTNTSNQSDAGVIQPSVLPGEVIKEYLTFMKENDQLTINGFISKNSNLKVVPPNYGKNFTFEIGQTETEVNGKVAYVWAYLISDGKHKTHFFTLVNEDNKWVIEKDEAFGLIESNNAK